MDEAPGGRLRAQRERLAMSRRAIAEILGVPIDTLRAWENGTRRPSEPRLRNLLDALGVVGHDANEILLAFRYLPNETIWSGYPEYYFRREELAEAVERVPWPCFVLNQNTEMIAANAIAQRLWGVDLEEVRSRSTDTQMQLLAVASDRRFADRILNWTDCLRTLVAVAKAQPRGGESIDAPSPYFTQVLAEYAEKDPALLRALFDAWTTTEPAPVKCRWSYNISWRADDGAILDFMAMVSVGSERDNFGFNDWMPTNAATWVALENIRARS